MPKDPTQEHTTPDVQAISKKVRSKNERTALWFIALNAILGAGVAIESSAGWGLIAFSAVSVFELLIISMVAIPVGLMEIITAVKENDKRAAEDAKNLLLHAAKKMLEKQLPGGE